MAEEIRSETAPLEGPRENGNAALRRLKTAQLAAEFTRKARDIARAEVELAKADVAADLRREVKMAVGLAVGGVCALIGLTLLLVAAAQGLSTAGLADWGATLIVAAVVLVAGGVSAAVGWRMRVREPLRATRRSLEETVRWAKDVR